MTKHPHHRFGALAAALLCAAASVPLASSAAQMATEGFVTNRIATAVADKADKSIVEYTNPTFDDNPVTDVWRNMVTGEVLHWNYPHRRWESQSGDRLDYEGTFWVYWDYNGTGWDDWPVYKDEWFEDEDLAWEATVLDVGNIGYFYRYTETTNTVVYSDALASATNATLSSAAELARQEVSSLSNSLSQAIAAATPADYANVSNRAYSAVQPSALSVTNDYLRTSGGILTGGLELEGNNIELRVGDGGVDDQHARLSMGELQVSNGDAVNVKTAHYLYDKIRVMANGSTYTLTLPLATGTLALLDEEWPWSSITNKPSWIGATKPGYTAAEVGAVPISRTVNGKALSADISLSAADVGAVPISRMVNGKALSANISLSAADVGAATPTTVTNIVRDLSLGGIWDEELEVWWTPRMSGGSLTYHATTNVNMNAGN